MLKKIYSIILTIIILSVFCFEIKGIIADGKLAEKDVIYNAEDILEEYVPIKNVFRELYGATNLLLSPHQIGGTVKDKDGFLEPMIWEKYDIRNAEAEITKLKNVCDEVESDFAYIAYPSKSDDENISGYNGWDTNSEESRAEFLSWLEENNYNYLDVRKLFEEDGYHVKDYFYKTDHHWTVEAGLYATRAMANYINKEFGYNMNVDNLDEDKFEYVTYDDLWLGETGRKMTKTWVGALDSFTKITPKYDTSFDMSFVGEDTVDTGDFSLFLDESGLDGSEDLYEYSAHYAYLGAEARRVIHNNYVDGPNILIIRDSFSTVVVPFLSLSTSDVTVWNPRSNPDGLLDYIRENDFDVVLLALTDYWSEEIWNFN